MTKKNLLKSILFIILLGALAWFIKDNYNSRKTQLQNADKSDLRSKLENSILKHSEYFKTEDYNEKSTISDLESVKANLINDYNINNPTDYVHDLTFYKNSLEYKITVEASLYINLRTRDGKLREVKIGEVEIKEVDLKEENLNFAVKIPYDEESLRKRLKVKPDEELALFVKGSISGEKEQLNNEEKEYIEKQIKDDE